MAKLIKKVSFVCSNCGAEIDIRHRRTKKEAAKPKRRNWTKEEIARLKVLRARGYSLSSIAKEVEHPDSSVSNKCAQLGV